MPTVSVRLFGGAPETAADLVRYANEEMGYGIEYWSIGNEPTLFEEQKTSPTTRSASTASGAPLPRP